MRSWLALATIAGTLTVGVGQQVAQGQALALLDWPREKLPQGVDTPV